ncbi:MAG: hypothetical protein ACFE0O_06360 [Opitutales bacterium]
MSLPIERDELKQLIKESVSEVFDQNRELFAQVIEEVIEDKKFMEAMKVGESTDLATRAAVFDALNHER